MSEIQAPTPKRRRAETYTKVEPNHHSTFWFDDGSVVLRVKNTVFRVHRSILCAQSEVFRGLFDIPQPESVDQFDGFPYVELHDELLDVEALLKAIYNPLCWDLNRDSASEVKFSLSIIKVSNKYGCHLLRKKAISVLQQYIPTDYTDFSRMRGSKLSNETIFDLLSMARVANIRIFMPWAYLTLATQQPNAIVQLVRSLKTDNPPWEDVAICLAGRATLLSIQNNDVHNFGTKFKQPTSCHSRLPSPAGRTFGMAAMCSAYLSYVKQPDKEKLFHSVVELSKWKDSVLPMSYCAPCKAHATDLFHIALRRFWDAIPEAFELGSWDALRKEAQDLNEGM